MTKKEKNTQQNILAHAKTEFLNKGYLNASLRNIVKSAGMTTGAFYGYYKSKEALFADLVDMHYMHYIQRFQKAYSDFEKLPIKTQKENAEAFNENLMEELLAYSYMYREEFQLILTCSQGTKYEHFIDDLVQIETDATHRYMEHLQKDHHKTKAMDPYLEHIILTGMFNTFFELVLHEVSKDKASIYLRDLRAFYMAGWNQLTGQ